MEHRKRSSLKMDMVCTGNNLCYNVTYSFTFAVNIV